MFIAEHFRKLKENFGREATSKKGSGKTPEKVKARREYVVENINVAENKVCPEFDATWYPKGWLLFIFKGIASDDKEDGEHNPFKPRNIDYQ